MVGDGCAALGVVQGRALSAGVSDAAELLATVVGQDVDVDDDGVFRIVRKVATDRVISTVDPDARHGHKTTARKFDGYKGHVAVDPDSEIITQTAVTPANVADAEVTQTLLGEFTTTAANTRDTDDTEGDASGPDRDPADSDADDQPAPEADEADEDDGVAAAQEPADRQEDQGGPWVYGDAAYGSGANLAKLEQMGATAVTKVPPPSAPGGRFAKDRFAIDLRAGTVTCPGAQTVALRVAANGNGTATFGASCAACPLREQCTTSPNGRSINVGPHEALLAAERVRQQDPDWQADYRANRPKVERRLAHLVRRWHGGRRARMRGLQRVAQDWDLGAAAHNIARLAVLGVRSTTAGWQAATP